MIKKVYYSTLTKKHFESKKKAQKAEDDFVSNYFKQLSTEAELIRMARQTSKEPAA